MKTILWFVAIPILAASCQKTEACTDSDAVNYDPRAAKSCCCLYNNLTLHVENQFNGVPLEYNKTYLLNQGIRAGDSVRISLLRYYLSIPKWEKEDGKAFVDSLALLVDNEADFFTLFPLDEGIYQNFSLVLGIDSSTNNTKQPFDFPSSDPRSSGQNPPMYWSWVSGWIFYKLEGSIRSDSSDWSPFSFHIGTNPLAFRASLKTFLQSPFEMGESLKLNYDAARVFDSLSVGETKSHTLDNMNLAIKVTEGIKRGFP